MLFIRCQTLPEKCGDSAAKEKKQQKNRKMIKKIGGWGNFIGLCILLIGILYGIIRKEIRINRSCYVIGTSEGLEKGVKGNIRIHYYFKVDGITYSGTEPENFCAKCKNCCEVGNPVIVRFEMNNPDNSDLVETVPEGTTISERDSYCPQH